MTKLKEAAFELDYIKGGFLLNGQLLGDLANELGDLSQDVNETKRENAILDWDRVQRRIRLLHTIATQAADQYSRDYDELDKNVSMVIREVQKPEVVVVKTKKA
ncbi:hypothetical protein [Sporosarcina ureae]|uniref:hypothetical protein n=1 Tax=Sporosarcina ureae TaxID=1571 RepID=UPI000A17B281|nr:hypothetical protein [Sporosarcina ureae]ARK21367.1 hypothetical protein SporoP32a_07365 [Sporosarcina ureae]